MDKKHQSCQVHCAKWPSSHWLGCLSTDPVDNLVDKLMANRATLPF